jgi:uncharacterized protein (TIGR02118 family)
MVKLLFLCRRRPDIGHQRYADLLLRGHVPLALRHHPTMRRYVVNIVEQSPASFDDLDSVGELWFDRLADFRERLYDSPQGREIVERDVRGFMSGADAYVVTEYVQKRELTRVPLGTASPGIKLICPLLRRDGMSHADFVEHWLEQHVPLALRHHPGMARYVTNVVDQQLSRSGQPWDGIAELHFPSAEELRSGMFDSTEGERVIREDIARFISRTGAYRAVEYVQKLL